MDTITNPDGTWVTYRDVNEVPERLRRQVVRLAGRAASMAAKLDGVDTNDPDAIGSLTEDDMEFLSKFNDAVALCLVSAWSFAQPVTAEGLIDLPAHAYDTILKHAREHMSGLMPSFSPDPDPKAPTAS